MGKMKKSYKRQKQSNPNYNRCVTETASEIIVYMFAIPMKVLHDNGWDDEQLGYFFDAVADEYNRFICSTQTHTEYANSVYDAIGYKFIVDNGGNE